MGPYALLGIGIVIFFLGVIVANIKIVPQSQAYVIQRLGVYHATWQTGIHFKIPFFERSFIAIAPAATIPVVTLPLK